MPIRFLWFLFNCSWILFLNALFYFANKISDFYHYKGKKPYLYGINNNILMIILCSFISLIITRLFHPLIHSTYQIEQLFLDEEKKLKSKEDYFVRREKKKQIDYQLKEILCCLKAKIIFYLILDLLFTLAFFYYATAFCYIFNPVKYSWAINSVISFAICIAIEIIFSFFIALLYGISIHCKNECLFNFSLCLYKYI